MANGKTPPKRANEDRMDFRLTSEHKQLIEKAAAYSGESLTGFAVSALVREARRIVYEHERVALSNRDRDRFCELLDNPPAPNAALRRAAKRHRDLIVRSE